MKMAMMIVDAGHADDVKKMLLDCDVPGYSEIPNVLGMGTTGRKMGSRAFPGSSTLFMLALEEHCVHMLSDKLAQLRHAEGSDEGIKAFTFDIQELK